MYWNPFAAKSEQILTYLTRTMLCANYNDLFRIGAGQLQMDSSQFSAASHQTPLIVQQTFWECPFPFYEPFENRYQHAAAWAHTSWTQTGKIEVTTLKASKSVNFNRETTHRYGKHKVSIGFLYVKPSDIVRLR
jgi:hypothetical protein